MWLTATSATGCQPAARRLRVRQQSVHRLSRRRLGDGQIMLLPLALLFVRRPWGDYQPRGRRGVARPGARSLLIGVRSCSGHLG
jgi:hypothetical protein